MFLPVVFILLMCVAFPVCTVLADDITTLLGTSTEATLLFIFLGTFGVGAVGGLGLTVRRRDDSANEKQELNNDEQ